MNQTSLSSFSSSRNVTRSLLSGALIAITLFAAQSARAATQTWDAGNTSGTWSTSSSWNVSAGPAPASTDTAAFKGTAAETASLNGTGATIATISDSNTATTTIQNGNATAATLTIGTGITMSGASGALTLGGTGNNAMNIAISASNAWANNSSANSALTVDNGITSSATTGTQTLTLSGTSTGANSLAGIIGNGSTGGTLALTASAGTWTLSGVNTFTGGLKVTGATVKAGVATSAFASSAVTVSTGTLDLNGLSESIGSLADGGVATGTVTNSGSAATLKLIGASSQSYSGLISGALALNYDGTGSLTLSGSNTYNGGTAITTGTLEFADAAAMPSTGTVAVASGATMDVGVGGSSTYFTSGSTNVAGSLGGLLNGTGTGTGTGGVSVTYASGVIVGLDTTNAGGTFTYNGNIANAGANVLNLTKLGSGTLVLGGTSSFTGQVTIAGGTVSVSSIGNAGSNGNLGADASTGTGSTAPIVIGNNATGNNGTLLYTGSGETTNRNIYLDLSGATNPAVITSNSTGTPLILTGAITVGAINATAVQTLLVLNGSGSGELTGNYSLLAQNNFPGISMRGTGTWFLSGLRNYQNQTDVESGTLQFDSIANTGTASALGTGTSIAAPWLPNAGKAGTGGQFAPYAITLGTSSTTGTLDYVGTGGSGTGTSNRIIGLNGNGIIENTAVGSSNTLNLSGMIAPVSTLAGGVTLSLDGTNTGNNLIGGAIGNLNNPASTSTFASGAGSIVVGSAAGYAVGQTINGTGIAPNTIILAINTTTNTLYLGTNTTATESTAVTINGGTTTLGLTKQGTGTWILDGANTYSGATAVNAGTLQVGNGDTNGTLGSTSGISVSSGATLVFDRTDSYGGNLATAITDGGVAGGAVTVNAGTLTTTATNSYTGATTIGSGATLQLGSAGTAGALSTSSAITDNGTFTIDRTDAVSQGSSGGTQIFGGAISGSGGLTQLGSGTTTLTAANTYHGTTLISAGTLAMASGSSLYGSDAVVANGTFDISQSANQTIGDLSGSGTVYLGANQLTISDGTTQTFSGAIKDGGINATTGGSLAVNGGGKLILSGINNYTGATSVGASVASVLEYASAGALGSTSGINVGNGSTVQLAGVGTSTNTGTITLNGGLGGVHGAAQGSLENVSGVNTLVNPISLAATSDIFADSGSTLNLQGAISNTATATLLLKGAGTGNISGAISDGTGATSVNVTASGGTWNLSGVNTYSGPTTISAGTLGITGSGSLGSGSYAGTIANSGTFTYSSSANQTLTGLIKNSGSVVQTAGTLTVTNDNTYSGGTTIKGGTFYADNTNSAASSTGTGNISVGFGDTAHSGTLAGSGFIGNSSTPTTVTVSGGGTISSGDVQPNSPVGVVTGTGLTFTNTSINVAGDAPAILSFALGTDTTSSGQAYDFANPSTNSTYMTLTGGSTLNFAGTDAIALTDLTTGGLALTLNIPYLLVSGVPGDITGLITQQGYGASATYSINGANGFVVGVLVTGSGYTGGATAPTLAQYTTIAIDQYGPDGSTPLSGSAAYYDTTLYLENGSLEVVPEPGTWALMLGGLALLIVIQRRRTS